MTLLVSKEIENLVDKNQFDDEDQQNTSLFSILKCKNKSYTGKTVNFEKSKNEISLKMLVRSKDLSCLMRDCYNGESILFAEQNFDIKNYELSKFSVNYDDPNDAEICVIYLLFVRE